jgi:hypothetical protein
MIGALKDDLRQIWGEIKSTSNPHTGHVVFDELAQWDWGEHGGTYVETNAEPFKVK